MEKVNNNVCYIYYRSLTRRDKLPQTTSDSLQITKSDRFRLSVDIPCDRIGKRIMLIIIQSNASNCCDMCLIYVQMLTSTPYKPNMPRKTLLSFQNHKRFLQSSLLYITYITYIFPSIMYRVINISVSQVNQIKKQQVLCFTFLYIGLISIGHITQEGDGP